MKPSFGIDAPIAIRSLLLIGTAAALLAGLAFRIKSPLWFWVSFLYTGLTALSLFGSAIWMIHSSFFQKPKLLAEIADSFNLRGDERVLDVGCGRGMLLIEMAKRLPTGKAVGVDLWRKCDQLGNGRNATLANAISAKLCDRIEIDTADMRELPYNDATFDAIVSSLAIHNISDIAGRQKALDEILRVLKPGGSFTILDIRSYAKNLKMRGDLEDVDVSTNRKYCPPIHILKGKKK